MNFEENGEASLKEEKCPILENTCNIFLQEENTKAEINKFEGNKFAIFIMVYSRPRIYQYNEDDFRFQFGFLPRFQTAKKSQKLRNNF